MPVAKVQDDKDAGSGTATPGLTLPQPAIGGNLLLSALATDRNASAIVPPPGWSLIRSNTSAHVGGAFAYKIAAGGEQATSWNWTTSDSYGAWVGEYDGFIHLALDASAEDLSCISSGCKTLPSGTTPVTTHDKSVAFAVFSTYWEKYDYDNRALSNSFIVTSDLTNASAPGNYVGMREITAKQAMDTVFTTTDNGGFKTAFIATFTVEQDGAAGIASSPLSEEGIHSRILIRHVR